MHMFGIYLSFWVLLLSMSVCENLRLKLFHSFLKHEQILPEIRTQAQLDWGEAAVDLRVRHTEHTETDTL